MKELMTFELNSEARRTSTYSVEIQKGEREIKYVTVTLLKVTLLHGCSSRFLNCKNGTKLRKTSHIYGVNNLVTFKLN